MGMMILLFSFFLLFFLGGRGVCVCVGEGGGGKIKALSVCICPLHLHYVRFLATVINTPSLVANISLVQKV